jgi:hypothetical protein
MKEMKISVVIPAGENTEIKVIESLKKQEILLYEIVTVRGKNVSKNRNLGVKKTNGDLVAFVNSHSSFPENWTQEILNFYKKNPEIDIVGGPQLTPSKSNIFQKASGYALSSIFGSANAKNRYSGNKLKLNADEEDITSSNLICRREVFKKIEFDETLYPGEDPKFIEDAKKNNLKIAFSPLIVGYNERRGDLWNFFKQNFKYGLVRPKKEKLINTLKKPYFLIPSLFVLYLLFLVFYNLNTFSIYTFIPATIYLFLNLFFSLYESIKNKKILSFFLMLILFPTIHISYGIGFIIGGFNKLK